MHRTGHVLLLHYSEGERLRWLADWFGAGLDAGERAVYVDVAGWGRDDLADAFGRRGFDLTGPLGTGQLQIVPREAALALGEAGPDDLHRTALRDGFSGVRVSVRQDALTAAVGDDEAADFERRVDRLCRDAPVSVACQYDGRSIRGDDLTRVLGLHTTWVFESELSLHHQGDVIEVEGRLDTFDSEVLRRSVARMTSGAAAGAQLTVDLRAVSLITKGACDALVEGTAELRGRHGSVRMVAPGGTPPWLSVLRSTVQGTGVDVDVD